MCPRCNNPLVVGKLVSLGAGVVPEGNIWELFPRKNRLGRDPLHNDIVIDSNLIAKRQASFIFKSIGFLVINANRDQHCLVNGRPVGKAGAPLATGDHLKFGVEEFEYRFKFDATKAMPKPVNAVPECGVSDTVEEPANDEEPTGWGGEDSPEEAEAREATSSIARELRHHEDKIDCLMLSIIELLSQANIATHPATVMAHALDTVLQITHFSRGIAYLVVPDEHGEVEIQEMSARVSGRKGMARDDEAYSYPINQEMLENAYGKMITVMIDNPFSEEMVDTQRIGYQGVLVLPVTSYSAHTGRREIRALIYADSLHIRGRMDRSAGAVLHIVQHALNLAIWKHEQIEQKAIGGVRSQLLPIRDQITGVGEQVRSMNDDIAADKDIAPDIKVVLYREFYTLSRMLEEARQNLQNCIDS